MVDQVDLSPTYVCACVWWTNFDRFQVYAPLSVIWAGAPTCGIQNKTKQNKKPNRTKQNKTKQNQTKPNQTKQNKTKQKNKTKTTKKT